jgi:hypothetical protein
VSLTPAPLTVIPASSPFLRRAKPRFGVGLDSWEFEAGQQGGVIAATQEDELHLAIVASSAQAIHDQVAVADVLLLPPDMTRKDGGPMAVVLDRDRQLRELKQDATRLDHRAEANDQNSEDSETDDERRDYRKRAAKNRAAAQEVRKRITELQARPADRVLMPADTQVGRIAMAISTLTKPGPADDLAEAFATQQVFRILAIPVDGLLIRPTFLVAVPTNDRLMMVGPISVALPNRARNGAAVLLQRAPFTPRTYAPAYRSRLQRQDLVRRLGEGPAALDRKASATAASAFFAAVPNLLLGEPSGERATAWNTPEWRDNLVAAYRSRHARRNQQYLRIEPARQALAYAVADALEPLSAREIADVLESFGVVNAMGRLHQFTAAPSEADAVESSCWSWTPTVIRRYVSPRAWVAEPRRCPRCRRPADLVVNVPELPFRCMCVCGGAPGLPPELLVPRIYQLLAIPRAWLPPYAAAVQAATALVDDPLSWLSF